MKKNNKAFTLTEMLVALGVVAVLCAIVLPMIYNMMPNKNTIMAKRAYYTIQTIVAEMINDNACYPNKEHEDDTSRRRVGFQDGYGYSTCSKWGGKENKSYLTSEDNNKKFFTLFFDKLGVNPPSAELEKVSTDDGMQWTFAGAGDDGFDDPDSGYNYLIVDVNGNDSPNCIIGRSYRNWTTCPADGKINYDTFMVRVYTDGKTEIIEDWAKEAVDINNSVTR